jgi:hypothetical protein
LNQINVLHHAGVMHFALTTTLCDFLPQIGQSNIGPVLFNQSLLSILARASALVAGEAPTRSGIREGAMGQRPFALLMPKWRFTI